LKKTLQTDSRKWLTRDRWKGVSEIQAKVPVCTPEIASSGSQLTLISSILNSYEISFYYMTRAQSRSQKNDRNLKERYNRRLASVPWSKNFSSQKHL